MFRGAFRDELMCMMHFQILVLLSAEARLQREVRLLLRYRSHTRPDSAQSTSW